MQDIYYFNGQDITMNVCIQIWIGYTLLDNSKENCL